MLSDLDTDALRGALADAEAAYGDDRVRAVRTDVDRRGLRRAGDPRTRRCEFGGLDIVVLAAPGSRRRRRIETTTLETWRKNVDVLATGYFLVARDGFRADAEAGPRRLHRVRGQQERAGRLQDAAAYCTAKAAELHLARCLAVEARTRHPRERGEPGRRDPRVADLERHLAEGARGRDNASPEDEIEEFYRKRSLLKRSVLPEDVAEAVCFFASDRSASRPATS